MALMGNIGEWSEIYALFKILGDKQLNVGTADLEKIAGAIYPIISVLRVEKENNYQYSLCDDIVVISNNSSELMRVSVAKFVEQSEILLSALKAKNKIKGTFNIAACESFMEEIYVESLKADSSQKTDITIVVHDEKTSQTPELGFSIKSQLGSPSTLLNAGKTTNFQYEIDLRLSDTEIKGINTIEGQGKIKKRVKAVESLGGKLIFCKTEKPIFFNNLILIDSLLPKILSNIVLDYYTSDNTTLCQLLSELQKTNPLEFDLSHNHQFYSYKLKRFLTDVALGMMPSKVWSGHIDATGGYLIIKDDGQLLCYHVYNRNEFEGYLIANTKLETASSTRHGFGKLYNEGSKLFMNLNLQIRFIK